MRYGEWPGLSFIEQRIWLGTLTRRGSFGFHKAE